MGEEAISPLEREEYIEQAYFFTVLGNRLVENEPAQEVLASVREEILATTKLPIAIEFLLSELLHEGVFSAGMKRLSHYFTPFQSYVISEAENDRRQFDLHIGLKILAREAEYRCDEKLSRQGLFLYQFESLCRNRLGYDEGLEAMAGDPSYDPSWRDWIQIVRRQIGIVDLADMVYVRSEFYIDRMGQIDPAQKADRSLLLFGRQEGRVAWANRKKEPLLLFAAMGRQLGYPQVPRTKRADPEERLLPSLARRVEQLEARLKLCEEEQRGGIDLSQFYATKQDN
ncbi:MAG: hypothetical protein GXP28_10660, partial [Planctomycetes bacterium]|nr:hypothetical protein [Planctomycetota bacterium]